jgi:hypothetical protein
MISRRNSDPLRSDTFVETWRLAPGATFRSHFYIVAQY